MNLPEAVLDRADEMTDEEILAACAAEGMDDDEAMFALKVVRRRSGFTPT